MQWVKDKWLNPSRKYNRKELLADVDEVAIRDGIECSKEQLRKCLKKMKIELGCWLKQTVGPRITVSYSSQE